MKGETMDNKTWTQFFIGALSMAALMYAAMHLMGCARASGGVHAESIPNNSGDGATCYAIFDSNENPIGGNCK